VSKPDKPGELREVELDAISLVTKAANGEKFKIFKSEKATVEETPQAPEIVEKDERGLFHVLKAFFIGESTPVEIAKSGRKISSARLAELKAAHATLSKIIEETDSDESKGDANEVTKEEIMQVVKGSVEEVVKPIAERLEKLEKNETPESPREETKQGDRNSDIAGIVKDAVAEATAPLVERLEKVEKARGFSNKVPEDTSVQKDGEDPWGNLF
jgi:hypothetical protein